MEHSIYLISPGSDYPTYYSLEMVAGLGFEPLASVGDLTLATVAALVPKTWDVAVCLEEVSAIDFDTLAPVVGITGKVTQHKRMRAIADEFRRRGKTVIIGGPHATLYPESLRTSCDILVLGELEPVAERLFTDLEAGTWRREYQSTRADVAASPMPRWDLLPNDSILIGSVQVSRGCPHDCEFCAVASYAGRKLRHKTPSQVVAELDQLYRLGYRSAFLCDDNLTAHPARSREILGAIRDWNQARPDGRMTFSAQLSVDVLKRGGLLGHCKQAGVTKAFIGIETPSEEALAQASKTPNIGQPLLDIVHRFAREGVSLQSGVIVGFDSDDPGIFERQRAFWTAAAVPQLFLGALVALPGTRLRQRLAKEGRLDDSVDEAAGIPWLTNVVPKRMSPSELKDGMRWLCCELYSAQAYEDRAVRHLEQVDLQWAETDGGPAPDGPAGRRIARFRHTLQQVLAKAASAEPAVSRCIDHIVSAAAGDPARTRASLSLIMFYLQTRYAFDAIGWPLP